MVVVGQVLHDVLLEAGDGRHVALVLGREGREGGGREGREGSGKLHRVMCI